MSYFNRAMKLKTMGILPKDIPTVLGYIDGTNPCDIPDSAMEKLYEYYVSSGDMPYGTQKARNGDPHNWIINQLEIDLK